MTCWSELIEKATWGDRIERCTLTEVELSEPFDDMNIFNKAFRAWSNNYFYFPVFHKDGEKGVERVLRRRTSRKMR